MFKRFVQVTAIRSLIAVSTRKKTLFFAPGMKKVTWLDVYYYVYIADMKKLVSPPMSFVQSFKLKILLRCMKRIESKVSRRLLNFGSALMLITGHF